MESEGPYRNEETKSGDAVVFGPGLHPMGTRACWGEELGSTLNFSYAEGRKSMEKELKEISDWANLLNETCKELYDGLNNMPVVSHDFEAWKKARGIE